MADAIADLSRTPQHDVGAEQYVVGSLMLSAKAIWEVLDSLVPSDFWLPKHEVIVTAAARMAHQNQPIDVITLMDELGRSGELEKAGGVEYLHVLNGAPSTATNVGYYVDIVKDRALRRRLQEAGMRVAQMGQSAEGDAFELADLARAEMDGVAAGARVDVHAVGSTIDQLINRLDEKPDYVPTPWPSLDKLIGGLAAGNLVIVGARPGEGKTIVGLQCATRLAHEGLVAFISLEMGEDELQIRLIAQYGEVHMKSLRNRNLNKEQWGRVAIARQRFQEAPIYIGDDISTLTQIRSFVRSVARKGKLAGVVIDYLQLIEGGGKENRQQDVAEFSRGLKKMAKQLQVPVIALSQLSRPPQGRTSRTPLLTDLRESGAIEQDADVVLLLSYDRAKKPGDLEVVVAKNRHGEMGTVVLDWQGQFARLRDKTWDPFGSTQLDI
ncbi:replicative DNA helicase [Frigoribacterium sp. PhB107]|uniref:replicative DNA helicase n=1 Tax=Frigoribacterium sp. PhB107 TaxID=2485172 RepID=UPI000F4664BA|nr:replicative DNA helicase [Frigoribacterium sp. PhB107]ROP78309.1 replicative DNA helicase [Frigoribacterium sp. PhB107]